MCRKFGIAQSTGRVGSALVYRTVFRAGDEARTALAGYTWKYNHTRRHSHCGQVSPLRYEQYHTAMQKLA